MLINYLVIFWFLALTKGVFFWIYLWQLKNYHWGRFVAHFQTHKGKTLLKDPWIVVKIILLGLILIWPNLIWLLIIFYTIQIMLFGKAIIWRQVKKPVLTLKAILLISLTTLTILVFGFYFQTNTPALLLFDLLFPVSISAIVLFIEPLFFLMRLNTIKRARQKISQYKKLKIIAITGSYGKTSTKEFLATILSSQFKVLATPDHKNSEMGIAQTILQDLNKDHEVFIVEMGAYNKGGITLLCNMVKPHIGIVTGVNQQHLATFGSFENLLSAEGGRELAEALGPKGFLIVNGDNEYCVSLYKKFKGRKKIYRTNNKSLSTDIWAEEISMTENALSFIASTKDGALQPLSINVLGAQQVQNILATILVANHLGISLEKISQAIKNIRPAQGGMTVKKAIYNINIIDASYSSNPDGVLADLDYLNVYSGKKVLVMPCLIELGEKASTVHQKIGRKIADVCDLAIITNKDFFAEIKKGALSKGMNNAAILLCDNPRDIFTHLTTFCKEGDAILLEGRLPQNLITTLKNDQ